MKKNIMKKLIGAIMSLVLVLCMPVCAHAATPDFETPDIPDFSDIKFDIKFEFPEGFWDKWFEEHPVPELKVDTPVISTAKYVHGSSRYNRSRLEIRWNKIENAESYEVLITKADGTTINYSTTNNMIYNTDIQCPYVYIEETSTWESATVEVRAMFGAITSEWSEPVNIGCNKLHAS